MSKYTRRIQNLENILHPNFGLIPYRYLIESLPPMSAEVSAQTDAWCDQLRETGSVPGLDQLEPESDEDLAIWVVKYVPTDLVMTPSAAAGLLVEAYWRRDRDQRGEAYAWKHQANRTEIEKRIADRW